MWESFSFLRYTFSITLDSLTYTLHLDKQLDSSNKILNKIHNCSSSGGLQKKRDRAEVLPNGETTSRTELSSVTEDISVPKDLDLIALPQLCFPGMYSLW